MKEMEARDGRLEVRSTELLGDLLGGILSAVGNTIKGILTGVTSAVADGQAYKAPGALGSSQCNKDQCCVWSYVVAEMKTAFTDGNGCSSLARGAIRQGFHDAATWDKNQAFGGADGSLLLSVDELGRVENRGLEAIAAQTKGWYTKYKQYGIGMADLIQLAATTATVVCPQGPRIKSYVGRIDNSNSLPSGFLPNPFQSALSLIEMFALKTFTANDLVALVGAHSTSQQFFVDPSRAGASQDSTPGTWDTNFYGETLTNNNQSNVLVFPSDRNLATYSQTQRQWNAFIGTRGQAPWSAAYAQAYFRMSLLGVKNINSLTDCTKVLPLPRI